MQHTLLLADDSVTIQRVIELTFADEDVKVIAVSDGDQAIARLESSSPDIVLADIGMPGKNGYEVAKYIKQSPRLSHIPVVLLTGAFEPVDQARANEAGCDGVLAKPFEPQFVIGRVKDLLAKSSRRGAEPVADNLVPSPPAPPAEHWDAPLDQSTAASPAAEQSQALDDYFDRLDAAFQSLSGPSAPSAASQTAAPPAADAVPQIPVIPEIDENWFGAKADLSVPGTEIREISEAVHKDAPGATTDSPLPPAAPAASSAPVELPKIRSLPPLAEAFAAILAAEQPEANLSASSAWPMTAPPNDDDLVEQVTRRVLDHLSDKVVRDAVSDIVSQIAERLVREEIERIKASIR